MPTAPRTSQPPLGPGPGIAAAPLVSTSHLPVTGGGLFGPKVLSKDICWRTCAKPECIHARSERARPRATFPLGKSAGPSKASFTYSMIARES